MPHYPPKIVSCRLNKADKIRLMLLVCYFTVNKIYLLYILNVYLYCIMKVAEIRNDLETIKVLQSKCKTTLGSESFLSVLQSECVICLFPAGRTSADYKFTL